MLLADLHTEIQSHSSHPSIRPTYRFERSLPLHGYLKQTKVLHASLMPFFFWYRIHEKTWRSCKSIFQVISTRRSTQWFTQWPTETSSSPSSASWRSSSAVPPQVQGTSNFWTLTLKTCIFWAFSKGQKSFHVLNFHLFNVYFWKFHFIIFHFRSEGQRLLNFHKYAKRNPLY